MASDFKDYEYIEAGQINVKDLPPLDSTTSRIMKDEFSTGAKLTIFYFIFIFTIPIINWFAPDFAFSKFWGGMTITWFITSIIAMAMAFIIAYIHTALYEKRLIKYDSGSQINKGGNTTI